MARKRTQSLEPPAHGRSWVTREDGFTLIEAMIVLVMLALAMIPLASTQLSSRRLMTKSDMQTQALQVAVGEIERARMGGFGAAVQDSSQNGRYTVFTQVVPDTASVFIEEVQVVVNWQEQDGPGLLTISTKRSAR